MNPHPLHREAEINRYVNLIHNRAKRTYALAYVRWLRCGAMGQEPQGDGLSYMGAQAVRLAIREFNPWDGRR